MKPVAVHKRTHQEKLARIYDDQIAPVWGSRFGKMLLRNLAMPERGQILDISCGTGYPLVEVLRRKGDGARVIAIDASSAMLDIARRKVADLGGKGVFFRTESPLPRLSFADDVYDLVMCNLGLAEMPLKGALHDFARVTKLGGEVRCTLPLAGTWQEFHDIFREVLVKHDKHEALERLDRHLASYPTVDDCCGLMLAAGLDPTVEIEEFSLLFKSSREFFFAPVIEYGPLAQWKEIAGTGQELQDIFWYIKEAIDAYFGERAFQVTVRAGCLIGRKRTIEPEDELNTGRMELFDTFDQPAPAPPAQVADGSVRDAGTAEVDLGQIVEADGSHDRVDYEAIALDAFAGEERPEYLELPPARRPALIVDDAFLPDDVADGAGADEVAVIEAAPLPAATENLSPVVPGPGSGSGSGPDVEPAPETDDGIEVDLDGVDSQGLIESEFGDEGDTDGGPTY
ncbi:MAG TPA: class I SAM-dependent methyltransferase [Kofleriaceae bacterium]|nr:class I SAM-dependent methyltransferase [Kofleriaceae bacterium]